MQHSITTFGEQKVILDGNAVLWISPAAQSLFYLLLSHPNGLTRNTLMRQLGVVENGFRVVKHRLRQALGDPDAMTERDGRHFLASPYYQNVDFLRFEEALRWARGAEEREQRLRYLSQAMSLYGGDFLPDHADDWAEAIRTDYRAAYVQARLEAASLHCQAVECQSAVRNLASGLASDPLAGEQYHRNLMTCLCSLDRMDDATSHYRRFRSFLQNEVGDLPAHTTVQLADQIRSGQRPCAPSIGSPLPCQRQLLYGSRPLKKPEHTLNLGHLEQEVQRARQMLALLQKMAAARDWASLASCVQHFLNTHNQTAYIWLVPNRPPTDPAQAFTLTRERADWPLPVVSAFQNLAAGDGATPQTPGPGAVRTVTYVLGKRDQAPLARLHIAYPAGEQALTASDTECLARVVSGLTSVLSQEKWRLR